MKYQYQPNIKRLSSIMYKVSYIEYQDAKRISSDQVIQKNFIKQTSFGGAFAPKNNKNQNTRS